MTRHQTQSEVDQHDAHVAVDDRPSSMGSHPATALVAWRAEIEEFAATAQAEANDILKMLAELTETTPHGDPQPLIIDASASTPPGNTVSLPQNSHFTVSLSTPPQNDPKPDRLTALKARLQKQLASTEQPAPASSAVASIASECEANHA